MADILILGMEMPKHCIDCPLMTNRYDSDSCALQSEEANESMETWEDMRRGCPLVPLPDGHGRLGDLDTAEAILHNKAFDLAATSGEHDGVMWAFRQIKALPTILEAAVKEDVPKTD